MSLLVEKRLHFQDQQTLTSFLQFLKSGAQDLIPLMASYNMNMYTYQNEK